MSSAYPICDTIQSMFKRFISTILVLIMALVLFNGCSSADNGKPKEFVAASFVDDCRILAPATTYKNYKPAEYAVVFTQNVFDEFVKSDYYKNMTDAEREKAFYELADVLKTYSYGPVTDGFIDTFSVNMNARVLMWHAVDAKYDIQQPLPEIV